MTRMKFDTCSASISDSFNHPSRRSEAKPHRCRVNAVLLTKVTVPWGTYSVAWRLGPHRQDPRGPAQRAPERG